MLTRSGCVEAGSVARVDFDDDPAAPAPNTVVVVAVVRDGDGVVPLVRRAGTGNWALPGGRAEVGESAEVDAATWVGPDDLARWQIDPSVRRRLHHALAHPTQPYLDR